MLKIVSLILACITAALMSGLFFSFTVAVSRGLGKLPDAQYLAAMQSINREIQNPLFFLAFFGCLIFLPVSAYLNYDKGLPLYYQYLLLAAGVYIIGVFAVTVFGNVPLNDSLENFRQQTTSIESIRNQRLLFEVKWNFLNTIRTVSSCTSLVLVILACVKHSTALF